MAMRVNANRSNFPRITVSNALSSSLANMSVTSAVDGVSMENDMVTFHEFAKAICFERASILDGPNSLFAFAYMASICVTKESTSRTPIPLNRCGVGVSPSLSGLLYVASCVDLIRGLSDYIDVMHLIESNLRSWNVTVPS